MSRIIDVAFCLLLLLCVAGCAGAQPWMGASAADDDHRVEPQLLSENEVSRVAAYNERFVRLSAGTLPDHRGWLELSQGRLAR